MLYLVPSISLMAQTMREWSAQQQVPLRYIGICSDTRVARVDEDASLMELDWPVTTDRGPHPGRPAGAAGRVHDGGCSAPISHCHGWPRPRTAEPPPLT